MPIVAYSLEGCVIKDRSVIIAWDTNQGSGLPSWLADTDIGHARDPSWMRYSSSFEAVATRHTFLLFVHAFLTPKTSS